MTLIFGLSERHFHGKP